VSDASTPSASPAAEVLVNGEPAPVPLDCTVAELLTRLDLGAKRVAVALNRDVVPRSRYSEVRLSPGDRVEILEAVGGG
jgi:sulfur carrier protein